MRGPVVYCLLGCAVSCLVAEGRSPATFYVDALAGDDRAVGTSPEQAWKSLIQVNAAKLIPGDQVLFRRGGLWRGQLRPQSGTVGKRIRYSAYGEGEKPVLQQSIARDTASDWEEITPGLWATKKSEPMLLDQIYDCEDSRWSSSFQNGAKGSVRRAVEDGFWFNRVTCKIAAKRRHEIQLWGPGLSNLPVCSILKMKVRSTIPFSMDTVEAMMNHPPYTRAIGGRVLGGKKVVIGKEWQTISVLMTKSAKMDQAFLHFSIGGMLPEGAVFDFSPTGIWRASQDQYQPLVKDIGILILNHGERYGVKKWKMEDLKAPLDYWYDPDQFRVVVRFDQNPAKAFQSIELAQTSHVVDQGGTHDVTYDGLTIRYTGAHGFGGGGTKNITIRNCDICWIGGGLQFFYPNGRPVRYGNGIEFWNAASGHLIERNRIWEIYDAALTNQGKGKDSVQTDIIYRDNVIWNAEYSFEYWNNPQEAVTANILFEHNTCVDSGFGWAHGQRPDPNGAHLMFYSNRAATTNFVIQNNIFVGTTEYCTRTGVDWRSGLTMRNNLYFMDKPIIWWLKEKISDFGVYQQKLGLDQHSIFAKPEFVDAANRNYRLKAGSPGSSLATDGGPVGARFFQ